jgi:hypothetical protein
MQRHAYRRHTHPSLPSYVVLMRIHLDATFRGLIPLTGEAVAFIFLRKWVVDFLNDLRLWVEPSLHSRPSPTLPQHAGRWGGCQLQARSSKDIADPANQSPHWPAGLHLDLRAPAKQNLFACCGLIVMLSASLVNVIEATWVE